VKNFKLIQLPDAPSPVMFADSARVIKNNYTLTGAGWRDTVVNGDLVLLQGTAATCTLSRTFTGLVIGKNYRLLVAVPNTGAPTSGNFASIVAAGSTSPMFTIQANLPWQTITSSNANTNAPRSGYLGVTGTGIKEYYLIFKATTSTITINYLRAKTSDTLGRRLRHIKLLQEPEIESLSGVVASGYRYGFQKQEKDDKFAGLGNHIDYKFRGYDSRLGRFWSVDPLYASYPWNSSYAFSENRVFDGIELEGAERLSVHTPGWIFSSKTVLRNETASEAQQNASTLGVALSHPIAANRVGSVERGGKNISSVSGRIARHVAEDGNMSIGGDIGTERNAFRHALWQAIITNEFDKGIAQRIGNAHEGIPIVAQATSFVDFNAPAPDNIEAADDVVDFLNNQIGREIGSKLGKNASPIDIAKEVLSVQKNKGLWTATKTEKGISIKRTKITEEHFNIAMKRLSSLDNNGMNETDRKKLE